MCELHFGPVAESRNYLTLTYFRRTRGRGSPPNTLPYLDNSERDSNQLPPTKTKTGAGFRLAFWLVLVFVPNELLGVIDFRILSDRCESILAPAARRRGVRRLPGFVFEQPQQCACGVMNPERTSSFTDLRKIVKYPWPSPPKYASVYGHSIAHGWMLS